MQVFDLHILRMMAKPSYILACYTAIVDVMDMESESSQKCECFANLKRAEKGILSLSRGQDPMLFVFFKK